ncbi:MAG: alpha-L-fucosidase [Actinomycetota bacterium]
MRMGRVLAVAHTTKSMHNFRQRAIPPWWSDAKFGIFVHWTLASVPAFAPVGTAFKDLLQSGDPSAYSSTPYVEWYQNSLRFPNSPVSAFHREKYGELPYESFQKDFEAAIEKWDAREWVQSFVQSGAEYVVLVAKHADGYCLWPSSVTNPRRPAWFSKRDVVGELASAVRQAGLKFGIYYCGGMDWTFNDQPVGQMSDVFAAIPQDDYPQYADDQIRELINLYRPDILWNDVAWPGRASSLQKLFEYYYAQVPNGVVNDRWLPWSPVLGACRCKVVAWLVNTIARSSMKRAGGLIPPRPPHYDYRTPEYVVFPTVQKEPWECVRGMDESFAFNAYSREENFIEPEALSWLVTDVCAKGGNVMLNVGPRGVDGSIPEVQQERLKWLGEWLVPLAPALKGTRPWLSQGTKIAEGDRVRYTCNALGVVYAFVRGGGPQVKLSAMATTGTSVSVLHGATLPWREMDTGIEVDLPSERGPTTVLVLTNVEAFSN